jgi:hypothetical protein
VRVSGKNPANLLPVHKGQQRWDCIARGSLTIYYIYLFLNMLLASPENHISTGVHQVIQWPNPALGVGQTET